MKTMTTPPEKKSAGDASSPAEPATEQELATAIRELEDEITGLDRRIDELGKLVNQLRRDEDVSAGRIHAREIFERQQERLALDTQRLHCVNRIKRLKLGLLDSVDSRLF
jgi:predicted RNase H-like nuclease (RuvC/YqgF family)